MNGKRRSLLASLDAALLRLEDVLRQPRNEYMRDSAIQRFEFCYELTWKGLKQACDASGTPVFSPRDAFRTAFRLGLIKDDPRWMQMVEDRNRTTHTYNERLADAIRSRLDRHLVLMREARDALKSRQPPRAMGPGRPRRPRARAKRH
ncbi:MAG TPA: HI0074 family nucleotidyltransferase substrate-binding subunit [Vicinamibacteria bacterium]|nr:HI0074 family nucleotidyltransferase substrate-binding subunit [Vicinamibacteria bacterium]